MGQLMLSPSANVLSIGAARVKRTAAKNTTAHLPVTLQPPLPLTPQRLELIKTLAKEMSRSPSRIAHPPPPQDLGRDNQQGKTPQPSQVLLVLPRKFWVLVAALIFSALLPNLTLAPIFWLRFFDKPIARPSPVPVNQGPIASHAVLSTNRSAIENPSTVATPVLSAPSTVEVTVGKEMNFPIAIDGTDGMPASSRIVVTGLPPGSEFSNGLPVGDTEWSLKPNEIGDLQLMSRDVINESKVTIQLITPDGHVLADTATIIKGAIEGGPMENQRRQLEVMLAEKPTMPVASTAEVGVEEKPMMPEAATADAGPFSAQNPKAENEDRGAKWVKPSASVNLRKGPSSSASIISVVERGTKLRALARKKGWIQVSNPATSEKGWIYAGNVQD
jgi:Bacterial SH3 domain